MFELKIFDDSICFDNTKQHAILLSLQSGYLIKSDIYWCRIFVLSFLFLNNQTNPDFFLLSGYTYIYKYVHFHRAHSNHNQNDNQFGQIVCVFDCIIHIEYHWIDHCLVFTFLPILNKQTVIYVPSSFNNNNNNNHSLEIRIYRLVFFSLLVQWWWWWWWRISGYCSPGQTHISIHPFGFTDKQTNKQKNFPILFSYWLFTYDKQKKKHYRPTFVLQV